MTSRHVRLNLSRRQAKVLSPALQTSVLGPVLLELMQDLLEFTQHLTLTVELSQYLLLEFLYFEAEL
eukprot:m.741645 g.741645  ORF g.741645 m.741645 type:complete len:67 (-) comp58939_c0_seq18:349-549(-)